MKCGHQSADGARLCGNCGATLNSGKSQSAEVQVPYCRAPYLDLDSWVKGFEIGSLSKEEFVRRLNERAAKYSAKLTEARSMDIPADVRDSLDEEYRCGVMGIEGLYESVSLLLMYAENGDMAMRDRALAGADSAMHMLNRAMRLNWESSHVLEQSLQDILDKHSGTAQTAGGFETGGFMMDEMHIAF